MHACCGPGIPVPLAPSKRDHLDIERGQRVPDISCQPPSCATLLLATPIFASCDVARTAVCGGNLALPVLHACVSIHLLHCGPLRGRQGMFVEILFKQCVTCVFGSQSKFGLGVAAVFMVYCSLTMSVCTHACNTLLDSMLSSCLLPSAQTLVCVGAHALSQNRRLACAG